ncbi:MAG: sensor histidine kinase [Micromonosporaceae bacterium]
MHRIATRAWRNVRSFSARVPLRIKLITAALTLVAIALAVISTASIVVFQRYLVHQADQRLRQADQLLTGLSAGANSSPPGAPRVRSGGIGTGILGGPGEMTAELLSPKGRRLALQAPALGRPSTPAVPAGAAWISAHTGQLVTLSGNSDGGSWRVIIEPVHYTVQRIPFIGNGDVRYLVTGLDTPGQAGFYLVGVDLGSISQTIGRLAIIDASVGGIVIVLLAGVGVAVVRASLRPLAEIEQTAGAIAAGDLSRRVPDADPRTETGRLARSLNIMLGQIEHAFRARSISEATARHSEERMRRFVADASHELRTPLSVIRGFAEYYRQRGGLREDELERMIRRVEDEAARMGILVEDLLLLARLDQQRPIQRGPVDMLALAADAVQDARVLAPARDIQLRIGSGGPFIVLGDEARLRQIIGNLVGNALTHTPKGTAVRVGLRSVARAAAPPANGAPPELAAAPAKGVPRTVPAAAPPAEGAAHRSGEAQADQAIVLEVTDFGPGLTPQQAERVFERFYRADAARTRKTGGTGLGLAIVHALTAAHGGMASVESEPGKGATFRITLPMAPDAMPFTDMLESPENVQ